MPAKPLSPQQQILVTRIARALTGLGYGGLAGPGSFGAAVHDFTEKQGPEFSRAVSNAPTPEARASMIADAAEARVARIGTGKVDLAKFAGLAVAGFIAYRAAKKNGPGAVAGVLLNHLAGLTR